MNTNYCYLNGKILPVQDAMVSVYDIGLLRGYGIYEGITTYKNKPFRLADHLARFRSSAKALDLAIPSSDEEIEKAILSLVEKNGFERTNLRLILTGGNTIAGIEFDANKPTFYILAEEYKSLPSGMYTSGASLITHEHQRTLPEYKTINYITAVQVQKERKAQGAIEVLYVSNGKVLEAATSNIFIVKDGVVITPKNNVLAGITRKVVIGVAQKKYKVAEREVTVDELFSADEAFLTASYKEIVPITTIDGKKIADGKVGEVTQLLMNDFKEYTEKGDW
jgi:branched-chain amino acid aminotransferase